ncbi:hypothetical protein MUK42_03456 [Musa troglodytarum]|uniref:LRAT domain-containing protein n=1 Tax=Musa troglodytarum TaxID=320322 RepID=A0A9E7KTD2_9LILI|nr:hypothetical protein MUK42_03456 [Musa troglodytarum]
MGLLSNRIGKESLKPGDHIYSWRTAYIYAHHGLYVGDDKVIHFTRGRVAPAPIELSARHAPTNHWSRGSDVFLSQLFPRRRRPIPLRVRRQSCTVSRQGPRWNMHLAASDPSEMVIHRAKYLLNNGFRCYSVFKTNCEDFAIYCKTGLLVAERGVVGQSGQAISIIGGPLAAALSTPFRLITTNVYGMAVTAVGVYCASRYIADISNRIDVVRVPVEELTAGLASGRVRVAEGGNHLALPQRQERR